MNRDKKDPRVILTKEEGDLNSESPRFPVDAHVHFHTIERVGPTLDAAARNFLRPARSLSTLSGALLLVQTSRETVFERLHELEAVGGWHFSRVPGEPQTLLAVSGPRRIAIVCGAQVSCARGLEVLALGTVARFPEGRPLQETIELLRSEKIMMAVPWGFLKWVGSRGRLIDDLFQQVSPETIFVGDNGGRLEALGLPRRVRVALQAGFRVLPGTDPFPFGNDYGRVGSFGFLAGSEPSPAAPWAHIRRWLDSNPGRLPTYGRALSPLRFAFNQSWIQVHNRLLRSGAR